MNCGKASTKSLSVVKVVNILAFLASHCTMPLSKFWLYKWPNTNTFFLIILLSLWEMKAYLYTRTKEQSKQDLTSTGERSGQPRFTTKWGENTSLQFEKETPHWCLAGSFIEQHTLNTSFICSSQEKMLRCCWPFERAQRKSHIWHLND